MRNIRLSNALSTSFGLLLTISAASSDCWAAIAFVGDCPGCPPPNTASNDFNLASNWQFPAAFPSAVETFSIQDNRTAVFSSGNTTLGGLWVSNDSFGRLRMTGGSLTLVNVDETLEIGREQFPTQPRQGDYNNDGFVDAADYIVWRKTLGQSVLNGGDGADGDESTTIDEGDYDFWRQRYGITARGGEVIMTGTSTLTTNGVVVGRRAKGVLSVGPAALVDVKGPNPTTIRREDLEVGGYGRAYITVPTSEPGLAGDGLLIVEGTVNANALLINVYGAIGEVRVLPGGRVNLNGALVMSDCDSGNFFPGETACGLVANPQPLMSSKLAIIGSGGTFEVGRHDPVLSPPPRPGTDPLIRRDIYSEFPADATISFTADAGGVTPIVLVDNSILFPGELTGTAYLDGTVGNVVGSYAQINLELNLDAYCNTAQSCTAAMPLTLIDAPPDLPGAPPAHLVGTFATPSFLGNIEADVIYDYLIGDVYLDNFRIGAGAGGGSLAGTAVPEPSGLMMTLILGLLLYCPSVWEQNGRRPGRHKSRAV